MLLGALALAACRPAAQAAPDCPPLTAPDFVQTTLKGTAEAPRSLFLPVSDASRPLEEAPVTSAVVMLTDASGEAIPGLPTGHTDARGRFTLDRVPVGFSYMVVVAFADREGRAIFFKALTRTAPRVVDLEVDTASTLVTETLTGGRRGLVTGFGAEDYDKAVAILAPTLTNGNLPDLTRPEAVRSAVEGFIAGNPTFGEYMGRLRRGG